MRLIAQGRRVSKGVQRREAGLFRAHTASQILLVLPVKVIAELFIEFCRQTVAMKEGTQAQRKSVNPVLDAHAHTSVNRTTPEMADEIRSQFAASRSRCRRPNRVSE